MKLKIAVHLAGLALIALGVSFSLYSTLGASPHDALVYFLSQLLNTQLNTTFFSIGVLVMISSLILATIVYVLDRNIKIFISLFVGTAMGFIIDGWNALFNLLSDDFTSMLTVRIMFVILSLLAFAVGCTLVISTKLPLSPIDSLMMSIDKRVKDIQKAKIILESTFLISAIIAGVIYQIVLDKSIFTQLNVSTLLIVFGLGPLIKLFQKILNLKGEDEHEIKQND